MAFDPQAAQGIGDNIIAVYARAELYLIEVIRDAIIAAGEAQHGRKHSCWRLGSSAAGSRALARSCNG